MSLNVNAVWLLSPVYLWGRLTIHMSLSLFINNVFLFLQQSWLLKLGVTALLEKNGQKDVKRSWVEQEASPPKNVSDFDRPEGPGPPGRYHSATTGVYVPGTG